MQGDGKKSISSLVQSIAKEIVLNRINFERKMIETMPSLWFAFAKNKLDGFYTRQ